MQNASKFISKSFNTTLKVFNNPFEMHLYIQKITKNIEKPIRNFVGMIDQMKKENLVIETDLFPKEVLEFYTGHNMGKFSKIDDADLYEKHYKNMRGGGPGDYSDKIQDKIDNVIKSLETKQTSKRAVLTIPFSSKTSADTKYFHDDEQKCLRELHFFVDEGVLHCSGYMRSQASVIFPKNIHFIGTVMNEIGNCLKLPVGTYTHFVTTLVKDRE